MDESYGGNGSSSVAVGADKGADQEESEEFLQEVEDAVSKDSKISRKHAHSMFVGPPESGKSSLMRKLLKRKKKQHSLSTGVADPVIIVNVDVSNPATFSSATAIDSETWEEVDYDVSLVRQMDKESVVSPPSKQVQPQPPPEITPSPAPTTPAHPPPQPQELQTPSPITSASTAELVRAKPQPISMINKLSEAQIRELIGPVMRKFKSYKDFERFLTKSFSLYLRDTGGQVEFQEMICLLISGPSIF